MITTSYYHAPCGDLILGTFGGKLCLCDWFFDKRREKIDKRIQTQLSTSYSFSDSELIESTKRQLDEYFLQKRKVFEIPLLMLGTDFQKSVWNILLQVPYGKTCFYTNIAQRLNKPKAVRAVASAIGANPISIIIPCHRIIGKNQKLTGYAGGLKAKQDLLKLEQETIF